MIALSAACFAGGLWQTTAQETLTVEYTLEGVEGVRHELQVDADEEILEFKDIPLTSLTLPEGLTRLRELEVNGWLIDERRPITLKNLTLPEGLRRLERLVLLNCKLTNLTLPKGLVSLYSLQITTDGNPLTSLKLPEDLGKNVRSGGRLWRNSPIRILLTLSTSIERLSVHKNMKEFKLIRCERSPCDGEVLDFPSARELIRNRKPDSDGVFRIQSRPSIISGGKIVVGSDGVYRIESRYPLLVEVYGFQPTLTITRKADGVEIGWEAGILQRSLLIDGPWQDIESGGTERRLFLRPSHPYEFFRVKPVIE